jgi:16S rRNA (guanine(966)-N(2))-methyltransferase RsmD
MIRIIAGHLRSRQLKSPDPSITRPTKDRVREGIFSAIQPFIKQSFVVDLYAGSGAMGIEALSRGASFAWLNDINSHVTTILHENIKMLHLQSVSTITHLDSISCLKKIHEEGKKIDLLFLDPPYQQESIEKVLHILSTQDVMASRGIVIIESDKEWILPPYLFSKVKHYSYGLSVVTIGWTS